MSDTTTSWPLFHLDEDDQDHQNRQEAADHDQTYATNISRWPDAPPWRRFLDQEEVDAKRDQEFWGRLLRIQASQRQAQRRGESFRLGGDPDSQLLLQGVNAAIHLRRPLLVRGEPGTGKTSLAYALAQRLRLGPVLHWRITARTRLVDGLYRYDALGMLQDLQRDDFQIRRQAQIQPDHEGAASAVGAVPAERRMDDYISLGPVGTAFLPSRLPRVLLIDEIDKADPQLPNELLHLFEEGEFDIPELTRERRHQNRNAKPWMLATADLMPREEEGRMGPMPVEVSRVPVRCCQFPIVVMTSNDERDFSSAFKRRCLRLSMPYPDAEQMHRILRSHFNTIGEDFWTSHQATLDRVITKFMEKENFKTHDRATDQLLNYIHLFSEDPRFGPSADDLEKIKNTLFKRLGAGDERAGGGRDGDD